MGHQRYTKKQICIKLSEIIEIGDSMAHYRISSDPFVLKEGGAKMRELKSQLDDIIKDCEFGQRKQLMLIAKQCHFIVCLHRPMFEQTRPLVCYLLQKEMAEIMSKEIEPFEFTVTDSPELKAKESTT